jgi:hypothetical protein
MAGRFPVEPGLQGPQVLFGAQLGAPPLHSFCGSVPVTTSEHVPSEIDV